MKYWGNLTRFGAILRVPNHPKNCNLQPKIEPSNQKKPTTYNPQLATQLLPTHPLTAHYIITTFGKKLFIACEFP